MTTPLPKRRCQLENHFSRSKTVSLHLFMIPIHERSFWAKNEQIALPTRRSGRSRRAWAGPWQRKLWIWKSYLLALQRKAWTSKAIFRIWIKLHCCMYPACYIYHVEVASLSIGGIAFLALHTFLPAHAMETPINNEDILLSRHATKICRCPCPGLTTPAEDLHPTPHCLRILQLCSWFLKVELEHMRGGGARLWVCRKKGNI